MKHGFDFTRKMKKNIDLGFYIGGREEENKEQEEEKVILVVRENGSEKWYVRSERNDKRNLNLDLINLFETKENQMT